ncbi:MAG: hypothetical protein AAF208_05505 [Cyanobacteria bacterium P01_A01_bin.45]
MSLENSVDAILRSHKIYRDIRSQVPDIHEKVYEDVRQQLLQKTNQEEIFESDLVSGRYPIDQLLKHAVYIRIDHLAVNAKKITNVPIYDRNKQRALTQLFNAMLLCDRLKRPQREKVDSQTYEDILSESMAGLWRFLCEKIETFDESRIDSNLETSNFLVWINASMKFILKRSYFKNIDNQSQKIRQEYQIINIDSTENQEIPAVTEEVPFSEEIRELIAQDPDKVFQTTCIREKPQANFKSIALLSLEGQSMKTISEQLGVPQQSLYTFYNRCIQKFIPTFHKHLQN